MASSATVSHEDWMELRLEVELLLDHVWAFGARTRDTARRIGILGPIEPTLLKLAPLLIHPSKKEVDIIMPFGCRMVIPAGYPEARTLRAGLYERQVTNVFRSIIGKGTNIVDAGANVGYYTLLASHLAGPSGFVYAFEPDPNNYVYLVKNIKSNGLTNVATAKKALTAISGSARFVTDAQGAEGFVSYEARGRAALTIQTVTLDDFFESEGWPPVDILKMDIEGSECFALRGMKVLCEKNPKMQIIMEFNPSAMSRAGVGPKSLASNLIRLNFHTGFIIERDMKPIRLESGLPTRGAYNLLIRKS